MINHPVSRPSTHYTPTVQREESKTPAPTSPATPSGGAHAGTPVAPPHYSATAMRGDSSHWIVNNCSTATVRTLYGLYDYSISSPEPIIASINHMLKGVASKGIEQFSLAQKQELNEAYKGLSTVEKNQLLLSIARKEVTPNLLSRDYGLTLGGLLTYLAVQGTKPELTNMEGENGKHIAKELLKGNPVIILDSENVEYPTGHYYLLAFKNGKIWRSDPAKRDWQVLDKFKIEKPNSTAIIIHNKPGIKAHSA